MPYETEVVILGAGLTGLSAAYHLKQEYELFEKEQEAGGLCRSVCRDGFTFDFTGHLLHFHDNRIRNLIEAIGHIFWVSHQRKASIHTHKTYLPYPFQAHLSGLPQKVICECLLELLRTHQQSPTSQPPENFKDWVVRNFGQGIARHFLLPYNQKMWRIDPAEMTFDWALSMIPVPNLEEVVKGCFNQNEQEYGYNQTFYYPAEGGIEVLGKSFLPSINRVRTGMEAVRIETRKKAVWFQDGESIGYQQLISSIPLPELVRIISDAPAQIKSLAENLRSTSVFCLNLGVAREKVSDQHWIYFPESEYPFYRVGFPTNFSSGVAPSGSSSLYVEISHLPGEQIDPDRMLKLTLSKLIDCGLLRESDLVISHSFLDIPCAYVTFDSHRQKSLPVIRQYLQTQDIHSVGRYGGWEYSSMGQALVAGMETARTVNALVAA
ncbi:MAG: FAD-dependent oxidoreductase [bacterium]